MPVPSSSRELGSAATATGTIGGGGGTEEPVVGGSPDGGVPEGDPVGVEL